MIITFAEISQDIISMEEVSRSNFFYDRKKLSNNDTRKSCNSSEPVHGNKYRQNHPPELLLKFLQISQKASVLESLFNKDPDDQA